MEKVFIKSYTDEISAEIAKGKLLSQGVAAENKENSNSNNLIGTAGLQIGPTDLYVNKDDEQKAISILSISEKPHATVRKVSKENKIIVWYVLALLLNPLVFLLELSKSRPNEYTFGLYDFSLLFVIFSVVLLPVILITGLKPKNKKIQSFSRGFIVWIFISLIPYEFVRFMHLLFLTSLSVNFLYVFMPIQFGIGLYLIKHYSFPRGFALIALMFPGLANLYFLVYGEWKKSQQSSVA